MKKTNTNSHVVDNIPLNIKHNERIPNLDFFSPFKDQESAIGLCDTLLEKCISSTRKKDKKSWCLALGFAIDYFEKKTILGKEDITSYRGSYTELCEINNCRNESAEMKDIVNQLIKEPLPIIIPYSP